MKEFGSIQALQQWCTAFSCRGPKLEFWQPDGGQKW